MHQPYYRDPLSGFYSLPWVRMHATRGYYDMISLLEDYPAVRQTFNLVPSLLVQLDEYARGEARDVFLEHSRKPAAELSPEEKKFILANFFMCNWETMVKPHPGYWNLLLKRGLKVPEYRWSDVLPDFTTQEFRDLQVWFNLTWFGHQARQEKKPVAELLRKGRFFSEAEKNDLLQAQAEIIADVLPRYRSLRARGQAEITATPFYHPILPLLIDWRSASRAMPKIQLPGVFAHPEDARIQIARAVECHEKFFGRAPEGMWPAEGSVSPEMVPLLREAGFRWTATDEGILFKSLPGGAERARLYRPYRVRYGDSEIDMVFRDRNLADLIGFTYSKNHPRDSVGDLLNHLRNIGKAAPAGAFVFIALDGENPWEYYPDGGRDFLRGLYESLSAEPGMSAVPVGGYLAEHPPADRLSHLHTGSWIEQNFRIWMGSPEDREAWSRLQSTRRDLEKIIERRPEIPAETRRQAWEEIYIAEGSDWFWWYGDDFHSDNDEEFDRLFRAHLAHVYLLAGEEVPDDLQNPIVCPHEVKPALNPLGFISPLLDGRITHFYEWQGAGYYGAETTGGSMYRAESFVSAIYYGFDPGRLYFRIDPVLRDPEQARGVQFNLRLLTPRDWQIVFPVIPPPGEKPSFFLHEGPDNGRRPPEALRAIGYGKIIELAVAFEKLGFRPEEEVHFFLRVQTGKMELERHPRSGYLSFTVPDRDFERILWQV